MYKLITSTICLILLNAFCFAQDILKITSGAIFTVQAGADLYVGGGINLVDNSTLHNDGIITMNRKTFPKGDFNDSTITPYSYGTGKFVFIGTGAQFINSVNQFERIDVDNFSLNLLSNINSHVWYLKTGKVITGSFIATANSAAATAVQADELNINYAKSWINGNLRRYITPTTVNDYQFPVGSAAGVNRVEMNNLKTNPLTAVSYVTASFNPKQGDDAGLNVSETGVGAYAWVSTEGVWSLVPDVSAGRGAFDIKLYLNNFTGLSDNSFGILRRPNISSNAADWSVPFGSKLPAAGSLGRTIAGGYALRTANTNFGQFGIGNALTVALPIQLLSFTANKKDKTVALQWNTVSEVNFSHFEIYRAGATGQMQYLDKVAGLNNTSTNTYNYIDLNPIKGANFYQLKMVDKDNTFKLSKIVEVDFNDNATLNVYPNPVINNTLFIDNISGNVKAIKLIAVDGKQIACNYILQGNNHLKIIITNTVAKGTYILQLITDEGIHYNTIIIQ